MFYLLLAFRKLERYPKLLMVLLNHQGDRDKDLSESKINKNLSLELDPLLKNNKKHDLLVCGTGHMQKVPPNTNGNALHAESDPVPLYLPDTLLETHNRKQTSQESGIFSEITTINVFSKKKIKTEGRLPSSLKSKKSPLGLKQ